MKRLINTYYSILLMAVMLMVDSCSLDTTETKGTIIPDEAEVLPGDVLFRRGEGILSNVVLHVDDGRYSHVGIAVDSGGVMMVVHAVPAESDFPGDPDRVKMELVEDFFDRGKAVVGEITRIDDRKLAEAASNEALRLYGQKLLFDHDYDDTDSTRMYCCELVETSYHNVGVSLADNRRHDYIIPGLSFRHVILPSDIYASPLLKSMMKF